MKNGNGFGPLKLNIGSGDRVIMEGYVNVDAQFGDAAFPLEYGDNTVDEIYASHILEHFPQRQILDVLTEWARVLKPGGVLKVAVPDFHWIATQYLEHATDAPFGGYLMGGQVDENDFHKAVFDRAKLKLLLERVGLRDVDYWKSEVNDCASLPVSLNLMGRKPNAVVSNGHKSDPAIQFVGGHWYEEKNLTKDKVVIHAGVTLSRPRHGLLDAAYVFCGICAHLAAPPFINGGAWWDQGLSRAIEDAIAYRTDKDHPLDVIVTMDFDTFATPDDAKELIKLLYQNPQYDCLVPIQARRGHFQEILASVAGPVSSTDAIVPIMTGHFGLTVFRRRVFERLRKPWFVSKPDRDGSWGDGRTDSDIYFWNQFADQGFKAGLATTVVIGHGEDAVVLPEFVDGKIEKKYISVNEWIANRYAKTI